MQKIHINETGKVYTQSVVVEFEAIFDIPFGIIRTIGKYYYDPEVFKKHWMTFDNYTLRSVLYDRPKYDPILPALIVKDETVSKNLYEQFMTDKEAFFRVMENSPYTSIWSFVLSVDQISDKNPNMTSCTIICKNQLQADWLSHLNLLTGVRVMVVSDYKINLNHYDLIVLEQYENILKYATTIGKPIAGRTIWIPEFGFNMDIKETNKPSYDISLFVAESNKVSTYEPYNNYTKPLG